VDPDGALWRISSFCSGNSDGEGCVEVAVLAGGEVGLRDSKDRARPAHRYPAAAWARFLAGVRAGEFDLP
jgi:Domain of unknown function (DUF397)